MIKHIVFFSFKDEVSTDTRLTLLREYTTFPLQFSQMRNFTLGANKSERDTSFQYAFSVEFDNEEDLKAYLNSPQHEEHVTERFRPVVSARAIVSYNVQPGQVTTLQL